MAQAPKSFQHILQELWELLKAYAKQETIGPLKNLGRQVGYGVMGSMLFSLGTLLLALGLMRWLQTHIQFTMDHTYLPYLASTIFLLIVCVLAYRKAKGSALASAPARAVPAIVSSETSTAAEGQQP